MLSPRFVQLYFFSLPVFPQSSALEPISSSDLTFNYYLVIPQLFLLLFSLSSQRHRQINTWQTATQSCNQSCVSPFSRFLNSGSPEPAQNSFSLYFLSLEEKRGSCWASHLLLPEGLGMVMSCPALLSAERIASLLQVSCNFRNLNRTAVSVWC